MPLIERLYEIGFSGLSDIALLSLFLYSILVLFKKTKASFVLFGIVIVFCIYLVARQFNLVMIEGVFEKFFAVFLIAVIVIFQEEIRHFFEQIAVWSLNPRSRKGKIVRPTRSEIEILVRTLTDLSREKVGALIIIQGNDLIVRHLDGGQNLDGEMSEALLQSLFDPHSMGHDGAVVINRNRIVRFACHLPLSKDIKKLQGAGTRHAAALGLSELSDALCLVVSEERGTISVARRGNIQKVPSGERLLQILEDFYREVLPGDEKKRWSEFFKKNYREKILAVVFSVLFWFVFVDGSQLTYKTFQIMPEYSQLPKGLALTEIDPPEISVTFSGPKSAFYFLNKDKVKVFLKSWNMTRGRHPVSLSGSDMSFPRNIVLENIDPRRVMITIDEKPAPAAEKK